MKIAQFMSDNKPVNKSNIEIDCLVKPFTEDINKLIDSGYSLDQVVSFLNANGVHLSEGEVMLSWERIEKKGMC
jgi:hypothetical protein